MYDMEKKRLDVQANTLFLQSDRNIQRLALSKDPQFMLPSNILKSLAKYREHFYCKYLRQSNNHNVGCLPSNIVQHWIDTSYLTIQPWENSSNKADCKKSTTETQSARNFILSSSKEGNTSKNSKRKKDSNGNVLTATGEKEIIDIGEGANHHDTNNKNTETSNDKSENIMLNDDEKKNINNNILKDKNKANETIRERSENLYIQRDYCAKEVSMSEDNITKLSHCEKLHSGRDSPVARVHEKCNNRSSMFELTSRLRPAIDGSKTKGYKMNKKKRIAQWSILSENMNDSTFIFSSPHVHERRKSEQSLKFKNIFLSSPASRNCNLFSADIANNMIKKQSATKSTNVQFMNTYLHEKEGEHDNLTPLKETLNDEQQYKILNNEKEELKTVSPENPLYSFVATVELNDTIMSRGSLNTVTCLQRQCNIRKISKQNRTKACLRNTNAAMRPKVLLDSDNRKYKKSNKREMHRRALNPVVSLERLMESDIKKYKKSNKREIHCKALNPVVSVERLLESDIKKYKKSQKCEMHHRDLNPGASLKLSESDIQKHKIVETMTRASTDPSIIFIPEDMDSDQSTVIIIGCQNSYSANNDSDSTMIDLPVVRNDRVNSKLKNYRIRNSYFTKEIK